jgi:hypothetical protein
MLKMLLGRRSPASADAAEAAVRPARDVLSAELDGVTVLLDLRRCVYLGLDEVGNVAWRAIEGGADVEGVTQRVCEEFDAPPESVVRDMRAFLADLRRRKLVVRA